jgi:glycerophosphoryl diester phosphodiesterase
LRREKGEGEAPEGNNLKSTIPNQQSTINNQQMTKIIIAHRGFCDNCQENTLESCQKAIAAGVDMIEVDVRKTLDSVLILFHDELINNQPINQLTYADINKFSLNVGFKVPTLAEILKLVQAQVKLDLELKEVGYEKEIISLVTHYLSPEEFIVTSFNDESLLKIKQDFSCVKTGLIIGKKNSNNFLINLKTKLAEIFPENRYKKIKADFLIAKVSILNFGFLTRARKNKKPVFVWTVNDQATLEKLLRDDRVTGIVTDKTDLGVLLRNKAISNV